MDRFFPGETAAPTFVSAPVGGPAGGSLNAPLSFPLPPLPSDGITSQNTSPHVKLKPSGSSVIQIPLSATITELIEAKLHGDTTSAVLTAPRIFNISALSSPLSSSALLNATKGPRRSVSFAADEPGEGAPVTQKSRFDSIINKYMVHSVAHPTIAGAAGRLKRKSASAASASLQSDTQLSQAEGSFAPLSQTTAVPMDLEDESDDGEDEEENGSVDLEALDTEEALRGGVDQYDLADDFIDDSELIAEIEMVESPQATTPPKEDHTGLPPPSSTTSSWQHYRAITVAELAKVHLGQLAFGQLPVRGYTLPQDCEKLEPAPQATDAAASKTVTIVDSASENESENDEEVVKNQARQPKGSRNRLDKRQKDAKMQRMRRTEDEEQRRKEYIEEHINKPWNVPRDVEAVFSAYEKCVKLRNATLRELSKSNVESTQSLAPELADTDAHLLDTIVLRREVFGRLAAFIPPCSRDVRAAAAPATFCPQPGWFPYELDDMLAELDSKVREANKATRPAAYIARLMRIRGYPASRESVRIHFLRAAALKEAAEARSLFLDEVAKLKTLVDDTIMAHPGMTEGDTVYKQKLLEKEEEDQQLLQAHTLYAVTDASQRFLIAADCYQRTEQEDDEKRQMEASANPSAKAAPIHVDFDALEPEVKDADADVIPVDSPSSVVIQDLLSPQAAGPIQPDDLIKEKGFFIWESAHRAQLFEAIKRGYEWMMAENDYRKMVKLKQPREMGVPSAQFALLDPSIAKDKLILQTVVEVFPEGAATLAGINTQYRIRFAELRKEPGFADPASLAHSAFLRCRSAAAAENAGEDEENEPVGDRYAEGDAGATQNMAMTAAESQPVASVSGTKRPRPQSASGSGARGPRTKKKATNSDPVAALFDEPLSFAFKHFWPADEDDDGDEVQLISSTFSPTQKGKTPSL